MTDLLDPVTPKDADARPTRGTRHNPTRARPGHALPWRWLAVLVTGLALLGAVAGAVVVTGNPLFIPCLLLLGASLVPVTLTTLVMEVERSSRVTLGRALIAAVLGGVAGGVLAGLLEFVVTRALGSLPYLMIGLIEESAKLAVPVAVFAWGKSRGRAVDGLVLGVAAGSGFAALETSGYAFVTLLQAHANLQPVGGLLLFRAVTSLGGHAAWTGLAAAAWFAIANARHRWFGWLRFSVIFATVVCLHALWDSTTSSGLYGVVSGASFVLLAVCAAALHIRARRPRALHTGAPLRPEKA